MASETQEIKPTIIEIKKEEEITITFSDDDDELKITRKVIAS